MARQAGGCRARQQGFSLIEIMVVVVIIGILAALIVPRLMDRPDQARGGGAPGHRGADAGAEVVQAGQWAPSQCRTGLQALVKPPQGSGALPVTPYLIACRMTRGAIRTSTRFQALMATSMFSLGADSQPGGDAGNADIGSWQL